MFDVVKIKENDFRTVFDITTDSGSYQAFVYDFDEVRVRKFDNNGLLDGELSFDWKKENLNKNIDDFYTVLRILIWNNFG